jgi:hypothetical protein
MTKPGKGETNEPDVYYPTKVRNYTRVVPADDLQGVARKLVFVPETARLEFFLDARV